MHLKIDLISHPPPVISIVCVFKSAGHRFLSVLFGSVSKTFYKTCFVHVRVSCFQLWAVHFAPHVRRDLSCLFLCFASCKGNRLVGREDNNRVWTTASQLGVLLLLVNYYFFKSNCGLVSSFLNWNPTLSCHIVTDESLINRLKGLVACIYWKVILWICYLLLLLSNVPA